MRADDALGPNEAVVEVLGAADAKIGRVSVETNARGVTVNVPSSGSFLSGEETKFFLFFVVVVFCLRCWT